MDESFRTQLEGCYPELLRTCRFMLRHLPNGYDDGQDLAQEAVVRAARGMDTFRRDCKMSSWLFGIARNLFIDRMRRRKRRVVIENQLDERMYDMNYPGWTPDYVNRSVTDGHVRLIHEVIDQLPERSRSILTLRMSGLTYAQVADQIGIPIGTVKSSVNRVMPIIARKIQNGSPPA